MFETIEVTTEEVTCDGGGGPLGHPKVYLHIDHDKGDSVTCGYCSRHFVFKTPRLGYVA
ncbi:MAG: zinc-finger domain-containing protein [Rickettsiales bacterium]